MKLLGIEMPFEQYDNLICKQNAGKELVVENGIVVVKDSLLSNEEIKQNQILSLKQELAKYKEDVEQVELFGMTRTDYETKKARCREIIEELRVIENEIKSLL